MYIQTKTITFNKYNFVEILGFQLKSNILSKMLCNRIFYLEEMPDFLTFFNNNLAF